MVLNYWKYPVWITDYGMIAEWQDFSFTVTCKFDYYDFPRDKQSCVTVLGSWMYDTSEIDWEWQQPSNVRVSNRLKCLQFVLEVLNCVR